LDVKITAASSLALQGELVHDAFAAEGASEAATYSAPISSEIVG
jgi:hypothetical protein